MTGAQRPGGEWKAASGRRAHPAPKGLWAVVRELTPAEGLALVCLASWAEPQSGLVQASDRQVCTQTGLSRDVMKRLRRKLAAMGIAVTLGNNLSHDSCSYDLGAILDAEPASQGWAFPAPVENSVGPGERGPEGVQKQPSRVELAKRLGHEPPSLGAESTKGLGAESAQPWVQESASSEMPYAYIRVSRERAPAPGEAGAIPQGELTSCPPTAPI